MSDLSDASVISNHKVSGDVLVSYTLCPRKAYLLCCTSELGSPQEYTAIIETKRRAIRHTYFQRLKRETPTACDFSMDHMVAGEQLMFRASLLSAELDASCDVLTRASYHSSLGHYAYEPSIVLGTHRVGKEDRLRLAFVSYVLGQVLDRIPRRGRIIDASGVPHTVNLPQIQDKLLSALSPLQRWNVDPPSEPPPVILNKHCPQCPFRDHCHAEAEKEDNLSLLASVTPKIMERYKRKGIFTITQLSYTFRPRRRKKRPPATHKIELQALAIRTGTIYVHELPQLTRKPCELYLDIEGIPDERFYYLIGLLVVEGNVATYSAFWADDHEDEKRAWRRFLERLLNYPDAPLYHYGSYDAKAIKELGKRYGTSVQHVTAQLINLNSHVHGKLYFPTRSNSLKDLARIIGMSWRSSIASGLQSLVWRYRWEEAHDAQYRQLLFEYNEDDCRALRFLADQLSLIRHHAGELSNVDYICQPKKRSTELGKELHGQLERILRSAHADYARTKISLKKDVRADDDRGYRARNRPTSYKKRKVKVQRVVRVRRKVVCPVHKGYALRPSTQVAERTILDLVFGRNGVRKTTVKFTGKKACCWKCNIHYNPPAIARLGKHNQLFGHGLQAWVIYSRLVLRLPLESIAQLMEEQFNEKIGTGLIAQFQRRFAQQYTRTEKLIEKRVLESPFIHVDDTKISIRGVDHYVWVFTDNRYVVFRITETREAKLVHDLLATYKGVVITDFFSGFDSLECPQQKCWSHLIRDLNDDLWKAPFNHELGVFVSEVRDLIVPIFEAVQEYGLKKRHLRKFKKDVGRFYKRTIDGKTYNTEEVIKYQKRFERYKDSLFTFLEHEGVSWHNNTGERALRHLAVQRKISGSFFAAGAREYLLLLGIAQTCRFQGKSMLKFLLSDGKDLDKF